MKKIDVICNKCKAVHVIYAPRLKRWDGANILCQCCNTIIFIRKLRRVKFKIDVEESEHEFISLNDTP